MHVKGDCATTKSKNLKIILRNILYAGMTRNITCESKLRVVWPIHVYGIMNPLSIDLWFFNIFSYLLRFFSSNLWTDLLQNWMRWSSTNRIAYMWIKCFIYFHFFFNIFFLKNIQTQLNWYYTSCLCSDVIQIMREKCRKLLMLMKTNAVVTTKITKRKQN